MRSVAFDGHWGALHRPAEGDARLVVVLCPPIGRDGRSAYRPLWLLAEQLAARGIATLRYDHLGTGDSLDIDPDVDQWSAWLEGVAKAAAFARTHTGAQTLVLAGLRLGATLSAYAAEVVRPDGLVLLAPVTNGKTWLRELQFAAAMLRGGPALSPPADKSPRDLGGLTLAAATVESLRRVDLDRLAYAPPAVLLAEPDGQATLTELPPGSVRVSFEGQARLFEDAHGNTPPQRLFDKVADWLAPMAQSSPPPRSPAPLPAAALSGAGWVEQSVAFGAGLVGVLCEPQDGRRRRAVIIGNTGGDPRAGVGGFAARAARNLAQAGAACLRFDFSGLGESPTDVGWRSHVYETPRTAEFEAAAELLRGRGYDDLTLAGVCSGAHHALHAALTEGLFDRVFAVNIARVLWRRGDEVTNSNAPQVRLRPLGFRDFVSAVAWSRLKRREIDPRHVLEAVARRLLRGVGVRPIDRGSRALMEGLRAMSRRGAKLRLLMGQGDVGLEDLERHFGWNGRRLTRLPGMSLTVVPDLDHGLFFAESQARALRELVEFASAGQPRPQSDVGIS